MGLLYKAAALAKKSTYKNYETEGLLKKVKMYSNHKDYESDVGLLQKAQIVVFKHKREEKGLLQKAFEIYGEEEIVEKKGLLNKAKKYIEEEAKRFLEEQKKGLLKRAEEIKIELLKKAEYEEKKAIEEVKPEEEAVLILGEAGKEEKLIEEEAIEIKVKQKAPKEEAEISLKVPEKEEYSKIFIERLKAQDHEKLINCFENIIKEKGFSLFLLNVLKSFLKLENGEIGLFFHYYNNSYVLKQIIPEDYKDKKLKKLNFKENTKLIRFIKNKNTIINSDKVDKAEALQKTLKPFETLLPWSIIPLIYIEKLIGFVLIGKQKEICEMEKSSLTLSKFVSPYIAEQIMSEIYHRDLNSIKDEKDEIANLLKFYNYSDLSAIDLDNYMKIIAEGYGIESAIIYSAADKGSLSPCFGIGISEKGMEKYKISKNDSEIESIIKNRKPAIIKDIEKRFSKFLKEDVGNVKTYIVVPVQFNGENLGIINILNMKGVGKLLKFKTKMDLQNIANCIVPLLLYNRIVTYKPYPLFEEIINNELKKAKRGKYSITALVVTVRNYKKLIGSIGSRRYENIIDKLQNIMKVSIFGDGVVIRFSRNKILTIFKIIKVDESSEIISSVKRDFTKQLEKRGKEINVLLYFSKKSYPEEIRDISDILDLLD